MVSKTLPGTAKLEGHQCESEKAYSLVLPPV